MAHGAPGLRLGWLTTTGAGLYERLREARTAGPCAACGCPPTGSPMTRSPPSTAASPSAALDRLADALQRDG
ncbi:hypothetical protein [Amycolatopsis sp. NPDC051071]|uniref:hypothetical protein n=1 Tax=Amycolatopsis sp. NPDC051071 TaxID=3154637 RepID=UPI003438520D